MSSDILREVIGRAVEGGYWFLDAPENAKWDCEIYDRLGVIQLTWDASDVAIGMRQMTYEQIIFSHEFAKAYWGENIVCNPDWKENMKIGGKYHTDWIFKVGNPLPAWQFHLCKLALSEDRLEYLGRFLK